MQKAYEFKNTVTNTTNIVTIEIIYYLHVTHLMYRNLQTYINWCINKLNKHNLTNL